MGFDAALCVTTFGLHFTMQLLWSLRKDFVDNRDFAIHASVRQRCVLSPRIFGAVLEFAIMACEGRNIWFEPTWWHEDPSGPKVCRWPFKYLQRVGMTPYDCWKSWWHLWAKLVWNWTRRKRKFWLHKPNPELPCRQVVRWRWKY